MQISLDKTVKTSKDLLALEFLDVSVVFDNLKVLDTISFSINKGSFLYIIGPNGAGKTTLIKLLTQTLKPTKGKVLVNIDECGYLPQALNTKEAFPITVKEVIYSGFNKQHFKMTLADKLLIKDWLKKMEILELENSLMQNLSGGEQQRVFLIRALISNPKLLILDEPTSALDPSFRNEFNSLLEELNKKGVTIIFVTHDLHEIKIKNHLVLAIDQKVLFFGSIKDYMKGSSNHV